MPYRLALLLLVVLPTAAQAQPVTLARVESMGGVPADYFVRDWKRVAQRYDSLAFDLNAQGTYLPLVRLYPGGFGLHTYVGTRSPQGGEAINALPALVGATLVGVDKRQQYGVDWVDRAQDYFVDRDGERVYLNTPTATSGQDWWYDTMPNVFFYQLYDLYGPVGDFDAQFTSVAERWRLALDTLGGSVAPWRPAFLNYRAFALSTMTPLRSGVVEPEAAGALAWLQYMAYHKTGDVRYRQAAEWALEFLDGWTTNPSYELQLPYGALAAARMNAEVGTNYDVEKLVRWSFEMGELRGWGTVVGTWGGFSASGLVGEIRYSGYAFALNGYQQAAALVPLVRYDDRFARTIGRWMLHLASASRLYYHPFLPGENQDGEAWAQQHDPHGVLAHEALRERQDGRQPYATGDAVAGGWAQTNFALYASSSVGYLAALVDTTDVHGILRLDLNATDFFADSAFVTALYYNPHVDARTVSVSLPAGTFDVYDAAADAYLARNQAGTYALDLPADEARVVVLVPSGGTETVMDGQRIVNGVVVDYRVGTPTRAPRIKAFASSKATLGRGDAVSLYCTGDGDGTLTYAWSSDGGQFAGGGTLGATRVRSWSSAEAGTYHLGCTVADGQGRTAADTLVVTVLANLPPRITRVTATPDIVDPEGEAALTCTAADPENDALTYTWTAEAGTVAGTGASVSWTAPATPGAYGIGCAVRDAVAGDSARVVVTVGDLVADLPLDGDAQDATPFGHDGVIVGATPGTDGSLHFDGLDDHVAVAPTASLNPTRALTVALAVRPEAEVGREQFLASHGSWQNRWKVSLTPTGVARWTVNTSAGIVDLDAPGTLPVGVWTHLAATFDGTAMTLYRDGRRVATRAHSGTMAPFDGDLLLAQMLPGEQAFNFRGDLRAFRLYNRALADEEVAGLVVAADGAESISTFTVAGPYPNPARGAATFVVQQPSAGPIDVAIYDLLGRRVWKREIAAASARQEIYWDGRVAEGVEASAGVYTVVVEGSGGLVRRAFVRLP